MESLIVFLLIAAGSAFVNWLKRRGETDWTEVEAPPPVNRPKRNAPPPIPGSPKAEPKRVTDWEAELRRMLDMEQPQAPPPPRPPPVIQHVPPPVYQRPTPAPPTYSRNVPQAEEEGATARPVTLNRANVAYERASHIDETVAKHLKHITDARVGFTHSTAHSTRSSEAQKVVGLLRNPKTARQVIIASVLLAPPKALEA